MKIFKDSLGRDWTIEINLDSRNQVKEKTGVDFLDVDCVQKLDDLGTLGAVLFALCEDQIIARGITDREFARSLKGDAFDAARDALESELCDFFPNGKRQILTKALAKARKLEAMGIDRANQILDGTAMESAMEQRLSALPGSLPASSASTQDD